MTKAISTVREAEDFIKSYFTKHSNDIRLSGGQEAYEFNIKCPMDYPDYVDSDAYWERMSDEVTRTVEYLKETYDWIDTAHTVGRSSGYLVLITETPVWNDDFERAMDGKETKKRANDIRKIADMLKEQVTHLTTMSTEAQEDYWSDFKPDDWDEQVAAKQEAERKADERRQMRMSEVTDYTPSTFYYLETTHRRMILNDRGDILLTIDKMCRQTRPDDWKVYGQQAGNGLVGYNRITAFRGEGIAPKHISWSTAVNDKIKISGLGLIVYNAPTGQSSRGSGDVMYLTPVDISEYMQYFK